MQTTSNPSGRRTAATWVAATGAFLLVAAAGVFVSVRWDDIPDAAKLGVLFALTGAALFGGLSLRRTLPATGDVLVHLGAFLLPIDLAAIALRMDVTWGQRLMAEGVLCGIGFGVLARYTRSVVLRWSSIAGCVLLAAGTGAVTSIPSPVVLVSFAVAALLARDDDARSAATWWAAIAGLAPATAGIAAHLIDVSASAIGGGTLRDLGFGAQSEALTAWIVGLAAAAVLAIEARRRESIGLGLVAIASSVIGCAASLASGEVSADLTVVAIGGAFLVIELAALAVRNDEFWQRPARWAATAAEVLAVPVIAVATLAGLMYDFMDVDGDAQKLIAVGIAVGIGALGWLAADLRWRPDTVLSISMSLLRGGGRVFPNIAFAGTVVSAVTIITVDGVAVALAATAAAAFLIVGGRRGGNVVTAVVTASIALVSDQPLLVLPAVALCTWAATLRARNELDVSTVVLSSVATLSGVAAGMLWTPLAAVPICWLLATALDAASPTVAGELRLGDLARAGLLVPFLVGVDPLVMGAVVTTLVIDAVAWRRVELGFAAALAVQPFAYAVLHDARVADPQAGVALCVTAIVWSGLAVVVDDRWKQPFALAAAAAVVAGLSLAYTDATALADAVIVTGGIVVAAGLVTRHVAVAHLGGGLIAAGVLVHLGAAGVDMSEPYVLPVAAHLAVAGWVRRQRAATSSWVAYVPSIALVGGSALVERMAGGAEWHALVVAAVGTLAVALGGWQRLVGPLLTGTALLVAITAHESLGALAGIPTWTWLAVAGTALLGTGVALERTDTSPVEAGRRLVDVMSERFE